MYIDGFVAPTPNANKEKYREFAVLAAQVFKEKGALSVVDAWGDDVPDGKLTSLPMAVKLEPGETVTFGWICWPDKATRDAGMAAAMTDPRLNNEGNMMPFDGKRMIFGGFTLINQA